MTENESLLTIKSAAAKLSIPYWKLLRAVNANLIPSYKILNSKKYVKLSDIEVALQNSVEVRHD